MPTRLYLPSSGTPPVSTIPFDSSWTVTAAAVRRYLNFRPGATTVGSTVTLSETSASEVRTLSEQFVSDPLPAAFTLSGTFKHSVGVRSATKDTAGATIKIIVKVFSSTNVLRGVAFTGEMTHTSDSYPYLVTEIVSGNLTDVSCQAGDRIVIERGIRFANVTTVSQNATMFIGDHWSTPDDSDITHGNSYVSNDYKPWFEFSQDTIWGPNVSRVSSALAEVLEQPTRTPTKVASASTAVLEKPARTPIRLAAISTQIMIPRSGQRVPGLYAAGFPDREPLVKLPDGRWVPLIPKSSEKFVGITPRWVGHSSVYASQYADVPEDVLPTDLIVFMTSTKMISPRTVTSDPSGIPGVTWVVKHRAVDDRFVIWFGTGATSGGRATYGLSGGDANRANALFVIRDVAPVLSFVDTDYTTTATPVVFDGPVIKRTQVGLFQAMGGSSSTFSANGAAWVTLNLTQAMAAARINPLYDSTSPVQLTATQAAGISGMLAIIG